MNIANTAKSSFPENRRAHERYYVMDIKGFRAKIRGLKEKHKAVCVGQGGCGFFLSKKIELEGTHAVVCEFKWPELSKKPIRMVGLILYCQPKIIDEKTVYYYGVKFLDDEKIIPLIKRLEADAAQGLVSTFLR